MALNKRPVIGDGMRGYPASRGFRKKLRAYALVRSLVRNSSVVVLALVLSSSAFSTEYSIKNVSPPALRASITLRCQKSVVGIEFHWAHQIGDSREMYRHIFYNVNNDVHVLIPTLEHDESTTGFVEASQEADAKAIIINIFKASEQSSFGIGVFPADADPKTGQWIDADYNKSDFDAALAKVARDCRWNFKAAGITPPLPNQVPPARLGE